MGYGDAVGLFRRRFFSGWGLSQGLSPISCRADSFKLVMEVL
jgi:hypothetical protein